MKVIPAISIFNGRAVVTREEDYVAVTNEDGRELGPTDVINALPEEYESIFVLDIDAISIGKPQLKLIRRMCDHPGIWTDAGVRCSDNIYDLFIAGVEKVVVGTKTLDNMQELEDIIELSENVVVSIDYRDAIIAKDPEISKMSVTSFALAIKEFGVKEILLAQLDKERPMDQKQLSDLHEMGFQVYAGLIEKRDIDKQPEELAGLLVSASDLIGGQPDA